EQADNDRIDAIIKEAGELRAHEQRLLSHKEWKPFEHEQPATQEKKTAALTTGSGPWNSFGEFLQAVHAAGRPGGRIDPRLSQAAARGAAEGIPSDGGFLVRTDYSTMLLDRAIEESALAQRCFRQPIGADSDGIELPFIDERSRATGSRWGGVQVYRRAEADT